MPDNVTRKWMKMKLWSVVVFVFVCCVLCSWSVSYSAEGIVNETRNAIFPALIMIGDSIVDTGTNNEMLTALKCNFPPYGRDFSGGRPTGRFSNGKIPTDFIAEQLGIKKYIVPYTSRDLQPDDLLNGINFASGGSGYDPLTSLLVHVTSLNSQLNQFRSYISDLRSKFGDEKTSFILSEGVVLLVLGSNDITSTYFITRARKIVYTIDRYADFLVQVASSAIQDIYDAGARKIGVFGAPPLGCLPIVRTLFGGGGRVCSEEINEASKLFNSKLSLEAQKLNQTLPQTRVVYIHIYDALMDIIQNPNKYGFEVVDKGCCGTGTIEGAILCNQAGTTCPDDSKYLFWDSFHPTQRAYEFIVNGTINDSIKKLRGIYLYLK